MRSFDKYLMVEEYTAENIENSIQKVMEKTEEFFWKQMDKEFPKLSGYAGSGKDEDVLIKALRHTAQAFIDKNSKYNK